MVADPWVEIAAAISRATGDVFQPERREPIGGGCINHAVRLSQGDRSYFVKTNDPDFLPMFEAERDGLLALDSARAVRVPAPIADGTADGLAFLVLEYIPLDGPSGDSWTLLGEQLAAMHRTSSTDFGWHRDNTIGSTPQINGQSADWIAFWRERRLGYQLSLAEANGLDDAVVRRGRRLMERLDPFFDGYQPRPSLLHGDLWGGNVAADAQGRPVLFDPAVYFGDRETDLAMSELFGRFGQGFYDAYQDAWPLEAGYEYRKTLYNLYHMLNHFNLFGGGYAGTVRSMIDRLQEVVG